jgi:hypothetical protein
MNNNSKNTVRTLTAVIVLLLGGSAHAQTTQGKVGINNADPQATLDVTAKTPAAGSAEGIIAPRLTGDQIQLKDGDYINSGGIDNKGQTGAIVYATAAVTVTTPKTINIVSPNAPGYFYFDGTVWQAMKAGGSGGPETDPTAWKLLGNASTNPANNFVGTTDTQPLVFRVNNQRAGYISDKDDYSNYTSFGLGALANNNTVTGTGVSNSAFGYKALNANINGSGNSAFGWNALASNEAVDINGLLGSQNSAFGFGALRSNTSGGLNSAFGFGAMSLNKTGSSNSAFGFAALQNTTTAGGNCAFGHGSLLSNVSGISNVGFGNGTISYSKDGNYNSALGNSALLNLGNGNSAAVIGNDYNIGIGYQAGSTLYKGNRNILIGYNVTTSNPGNVISANDNSNQMNIGNVLYGINMYNRIGATATPNSGKIGINTPGAVGSGNEPTETLDVNGNIRVRKAAATPSGSCPNPGAITFGADGNFYGCTGTGITGTWAKLN